MSSRLETPGPQEPITIAAIATPLGKGGVGIIRLSGKDALVAGRRVAVGLPAHPVPRHAYRSRFVDPQGAAWDEGMCLFFPGPHSFTGEDVVELHAHGSAFLLQRLLSFLLCDEVRLAEPGEFTRRAFLNGKLDLTQAEAVSDLVSAESEAAVRAAAAQLSGVLHERLETLRKELLFLRADLEAALDFPQESEGMEGQWAPRLAALHASLTSLLGDVKRGGWARRGIRCVLFGPVNAGKSTLLNALAKEERALVDDEPGTTRDLVEARVEWKGLSVTWVDTAGLREGEAVGRVERMGIERTRAALAAADVAVLVVPPGAPEAEVAAWRKAAGERPLVEVQGKADAGRAKAEGRLGVSGRTGEGVEALLSHVVDLLWEGHAPQAAALLSERHAEAVRRALASVALAEEAMRVSTLEVVAGELALASEALGEVMGENAPNELLDVLFQRFCIGK